MSSFLELATRIEAEHAPSWDKSELREQQATLNALAADWNESAARHDLDTVFDWADRVTPPGCWTWLLENGYRRLQDELDVTFDEADDAFMQRDVEALSRALGRFRCVINQAIDTFKLATKPQEVVQTPNAE
jgi:hypothetical protein